MREDQLRDHLATYTLADEPIPSPEAIRRRGTRRRVTTTTMGALTITALTTALLMLPGGGLLPGPNLAVPATTPTPSPATSRTPTPSGTPATSATPAATPEATRVAADPALDLRCRLLTADEWYAVNTAPISMDTTAPRAVEIGGGWVALASWNTEAPKAIETRVLIAHTSSEPLPAHWNGTVPGAEVVLEDGPRALEAARNCLTAIHSPTDQPRPSLTCETPTRTELLRVQQAVWGGPDGNPTGGGAYVQGGLTPEGKPWKMFAVNTDNGAATVLWTQPSKRYKTGDQARDEYSPISPTWDGNLAEFRGHVQWGVQAKDAAIACLTKK